MRNTTINKDGIHITKSIQKYIDIIKSGKIEERQIIAMKSLMGKNKDAERILNGMVYDNPLSISEEQTAKGLAFLKSQWKTDTGKERKNNPFGHRGQDAIDTFERFELAGFYDIGNSYHSFYVPIYNCIGKESSFQYYYNGEVNIIG